MIKSIEYLQEEKLIISTGYDKKVKIWNSETGQQIDSFQQNYDKKEPKPIAFKKSGTDEIYDINLDTRIDLKAVQKRNHQK